MGDRPRRFVIVSLGLIVGIGCAAAATGRMAELLHLVTGALPV